MRRRRMSTACFALHRAYVERVPYEDLAVQLGETAPLDETALIGRLLHDGRGGYCFELNTVLAALLRAVGLRRHPPRGRRRRRGADQPHGAARAPRRRALAGGRRPGRGLSGPAALPRGRDHDRPVHLHAGARGRRLVVDGPARVELVQRLPDDRGGAAVVGLRLRTTAGWRPTRSPASSRRWWCSSRWRTGSSRCARARCRRSARRSTPSASSSATSSPTCCPRSSGSRSVASGWSGCGRNALEQHDAFLTRT